MAEKKTEKVNKMAAVREALAELGKNATVVEIQAYLLEHSGLDMSSKFVSTYRANILKKAAKAKAASRTLAKKAAPAAPKAKPAPVAANGKKEVTVEMEDVLTLRRLLDSVGPEHLRMLIGAIAP